jgi:hypothetical protein
MGDLPQGQQDITGAHQSGTSAYSASVNSAAFAIIVGAVIGLWIIGVFIRKG